MTGDQAEAVAREALASAAVSLLATVNKYQQFSRMHADVTREHEAATVVYNTALAEWLIARGDLTAEALQQAGLMQVQEAQPSRPTVIRSGPHGDCATEGVHAHEPS